MIRVALIGVGKMGLSHLSILGAHPQVEVAGVSDSSKVILDVLDRFTGFKTYSDYKKMIKELKPDAVFVAVPTKFHSAIVSELLSMNIHVFVEKPFCLNYEESFRLAELAEEKGVVNQVGYHNRFIGTFEEAKKIIDQGFLGDITHFTGEAYGPVVIRRKNNTWRSIAEEGGGCLMDYASHVIDLIHYIISPIKKIRGSILKKVFSDSVDDSVYALLETEINVTGLISVNWSDETYRKMYTSMTINGNSGKIIVDATELKVYFNSDVCPTGFEKGWNIKYVTDLTRPVDFYLRGEEYSLQIDYFIQSIIKKSPVNINSFSSATKSDEAISLIKTYN